MVVQIGIEPAEVVSTVTRWPLGLELHYRYRGSEYLTYSTGSSLDAVTRAIVDDQCGERATPMVITD